jgi:hypothetical protein
MTRNVENMKLFSKGTSIYIFQIQTLRPILILLSRPPTHLIHLDVQIRILYAFIVVSMLSTCPFNPAFLI